MTASSRKIPEVHSLLVFVVLVLLGIFFNLTGNYYPVIPDSDFLTWTIAAAVSSGLLGIAVLLKVTTVDHSSLRVLLRYGAIGLGTSYFLWHGLLPTINGFFDSGPGVEKNASVLYPFTQGQRRMMVDMVAVRLDEPPYVKIEMVENLPRDWELYRKTRNAPVPVIVTEKPGFLGFRWVDSYRYSVPQ